MTVNLFNFLIIPWIAGVGLSFVTSGMGCLLVWRRLSFFGDALAHSTLLGVALSLVFNMSVFLGIVIVCILIGLILGNLPKQSRIGSDTWLAILSYGSLALGMIAIGKIPGLRVDPSSYLFGDILIVTGWDIGVLCIVALFLFIFLGYHWRSLILMTLNRDLAQAEGVKVFHLERQLTVLLAITVAACLKLIGALLVPALLIIPAATASSRAKNPKIMIVSTFFITLISTSLGLFLSVYWNTPSGPMIVVVSLALFLMSHFFKP